MWFVAFWCSSLLCEATKFMYFLRISIPSAFACLYFIFNYNFKRLKMWIIFSVGLAQRNEIWPPSIQKQRTSKKENQNKFNKKNNEKACQLDQLTLVDDDLCLRDAFVWEWDDLVVVVSVGTVVVAVVPDEFVMWSAGNDSGTVCNVDLIVADMISAPFRSGLPKKISVWPRDNFFSFFCRFLPIASLQLLQRKWFSKILDLITDHFKIENRLFSEIFFVYLWEWAKLKWIVNDSSLNLFLTATSSMTKIMCSMLANEK